MKFLAVLALSLFAIACSAEPQTSSAQQDSDRGVAAAPLPRATPTVNPAEPATQLDEQPTDPATPGATFDRARDVDLDGNGKITEDERGAHPEYPAISGRPITPKMGDVVAVDYGSTPARVTTLAHDTPLPAIITDQTTPDGDNIWVSLPALNPPADQADCGLAPATQLGVQPFDPAGPASLAEPIERLPFNISQIHHGPNNRALLYSTCGDATRPVAFATSTASGDFTDIVRVDPLLSQTTAASTPEWLWASVLPLTDYFAPGDLVAMIPQQGLTATGVDAGTPSHVYVDATTGSVLDVWATDIVTQRPVGFGMLEVAGQEVRIGGTAIDLPQRNPTVIEARSSAGPGQHARVVVAGPDGASIVTPKQDAEVDITDLGHQPITTAAWAPVGPWLALSGPGAGTWLYADGETMQLSDLDGQAIYFSADGTTLVIATDNAHEIIEFAEMPEPDDSVQITAFSTLDSGGLGPLRVEMLVSEARKQLGIDFEIDGIDGIQAGYCVWIYSPDLPGISMLGEGVSDTDAVITSVVVYQGPWRTPSGIRIGASEDAVLDAFPGQIDRQGHAYSAGSYLFFTPEDTTDNYSIKFETDAHHVTAMHAGRRDWISFVEGCA